MTEKVRKSHGYSELTHVFGTAGRVCFRFRLQGIRQSNKPAIQLKTIRKRKNSLRSDSFLFLINAASQALTLSNALPQSPFSFPPQPSRKVYHSRLFRIRESVCCIRLIFSAHPFRNTPQKNADFKTAGRNRNLYRQIHDFFRLI